MYNVSMKLKEERNSYPGIMIKCAVYVTFSISIDVVTMRENSYSRVFTIRFNFVV